MATNTPPADVLARIPKLRERLASSASGFVRTARMGAPDRTALALMIERGEVVVIETSFGKAYKLTEKGRKERGGSA